MYLLLQPKTVKVLSTPTIFLTRRSPAGPTGSSDWLPLNDSSGRSRVSSSSMSSGSSDVVRARRAQMSLARDWSSEANRATSNLYSAVLSGTPMDVGSSAYRRWQLVIC
jgi:hypothetical protein